MNYAALAASDGSGEAVRATVQSPGRDVGSSAIPVDAITNWPTGTFIATTGTLQANGTLDPSTVQVFYGTASGTTVTITSFAAGYTDKGNIAGDVVVIKPTTEWANIASDGILSNIQFPANFANFVEPSGGVWTVSSGLVGTATAGYVWYQGARSAMAAVVAYTFTASKDTYVDYNPSTAAWTYVPETNGTLEPAVTSGCVRIAKVVTGSSTISSISQQAYSEPLPLVWKYLGSAQIVADVTNTAPTSPTQVTGVTVTVTVPTNTTKVRVTAFSRYIFGNAAVNSIASLWDGTVGSGTELQQYEVGPAAGDTNGLNIVALYSPAAGSHTYNLAIQASSGNVTVGAASIAPAFILVEAC